MKTQTKHTVQHSSGTWMTERANSGRIIYTETQRDFETKEVRTLAFLVRNEAQFPVEQADANGRLMAAAPDLLAALEQCRDFVSAYIKAGQSGASVAELPGPYEIEKAINRAIDKANGK